MSDNASRRLPFAEFITLMALMTSLIALSIDAVLPALPQIGADFGLRRANDGQLVVSVLFLGLAVGQLFYGPVSDSLGRKKPIYVGFILFIAGSLLALLAQTFPLMLAGRLLQGLGAAGPRSVSLALVRDLYEGDRMAEVMSYVMTIFILVPVLAPAYGQAVLNFANWQAIFVSFILLSILALGWFSLRQPETLPAVARSNLSLWQFFRAAKAVLTNRKALGYTLAAGFISGAFLGYLNSAQQIYQGQYGLGQRFPLFFAAASLALGLASFANARLVLQLGMQHLARTALITLSSLSAVALIIAYVQEGTPPLWQFMTFILAAFFCVGILFGNLNALAMQPLGHVAGIGAATVGSLSTLMSVPLGTFIGQRYDGTLLPLIGGFTVMGVLALGLSYWAAAADSSLAE